MKATSEIPKGPYCYTYKGDEFVLCPYYKTMQDRQSQYNGYCEYLEMGDVELARGALYEDENGNIVTGESLPFPTSLLWDQVKECGINDDWEEE